MERERISVIKNKYTDTVYLDKVFTELNIEPRYVKSPSSDYYKGNVHNIKKLLYKIWESEKGIVIANGFIRDDDIVLHIIGATRPDGTPHFVCSGIKSQPSLERQEIVRVLRLLESYGVIRL